MEKYYLEINLRRWAIIQYSGHIWKRPELKVHLAKMAINHTYWEADTMPTSLHDELNALFLPRLVRDEVKFAIGSMGCRIRKWLKRCSQGNPDIPWNRFVDYLDHVHWSYLGCMDLSQTVRSLYKSGLLSMRYDTWIQLCMSCDEECITDFWEKVCKGDEYIEIRKKMVSSAVNNYSYLRQYWRLRMENNLAQFKNKIYDYWDSPSIDEYMLQKSHEKLHRGFAYFWTRLRDDKRKPILQGMINSYKNDGCNWLEVDWELRMDIIMFMVQRYSECGFDEVFTEMLESPTVLSEMLLWPCQCKVMPVLEEICSKRKSFKYEPVIMKLLDLMYYERVYIGNDSRARKLFCDLWNNKDTYKFKEEMVTQPIYTICMIKDRESLKFIVVNQKSWKETERVLRAVVAFYEVPSSDFGFLKKFFEELPQELAVREWLKQKLLEIGIEIEAVQQ